MAVSVTVFITAPRGCGRLGRILAALRGQLGLADRLVLFDGTADGPPPEAAALPEVGRFEHVRATGESAFEMRVRMPTMSDRDATVLFEDHTVPGPNFLAEVRRLFADPRVVAVKLLGRNDTSTDPWGWANFLVGFAECLHPAKAMPQTLLSTSAAVRTSALVGALGGLGAWETQVMPGFNRDPARLAWSNEVWVDHLEASSMRLALARNFHNQRAVAAMRVAGGHRRGKLTVRAIKDLGLRRPGAIARSLAGRAEHRHVVENRWRIRLICWAATAGAIAGAWLGAGASMRKMH
jgi:hypothetical protein